MSNSMLSAHADVGFVDRLTALNPSKTAALSMSKDQIDQVAKDFESMFISQMMEQMFGDSEGPDAFGNNETDGIYKGLMMDEYGKQIARHGGIGIAEYIKQDLTKQALLKLQEV